MPSKVTQLWLALLFGTRGVGAVSSVPARKCPSVRNIMVGLYGRCLMGNPSARSFGIVFGNSGLITPGVGIVKSHCETHDGNFWIARDPEREGLVIAAG